MMRKTKVIFDELHLPESDQVDYARRWLDFLKGENRGKAVELMEQVADEEITSEEGLALLDRLFCL